MTSLHTGTRTLYMSGKGKGEVHPRTAHEGPKGEWRYSCTRSLTSGSSP